MAFSYSPKLMLWAGLTAALGWVAGVLWLLSLPATHTPFYHPPAMTPDQHLASHLDAHFVDTNVGLQNLVLLLLVAGILVVVVRRSRRLVIRQAEIAHERAALARYFSPNVLDEVVEAVGPLTAVRKHEVAILFADIVGFTQLCETMPPENVMELLREYHSRLEEEVFRFDGTLDKFIGDAVMASFGAPKPGPQDGTNGLRCARAMIQSMAEWNHLREGIGEAPIQIGIGLHYGLAVMGDVGSERCAAFAVIGDTTNTTSRLQSLTRDLGADIVVSQTLLEAVRRETPETDQELEGFRDAGKQPIRGRQKAMHVWVLPIPNLCR
jgi:adenylate cyclase